MISPDRIMQIMEVEPRVFWEVVAVDPDFPKPAYAASRKLRRYYEIEVDQFFAKKAAKFRSKIPH